MKKVGLATCFLDNYGACLQAYALSNTITSLGMECTILNYTELEGYYGDSIAERVKNSTLYNTVRCLLDKKYRKTFKLGKIRRPNFQSFRKKYLPLSTEAYNEHSDLSDKGFDAVVCGSDQIWNPTFYGACNPFYYLSFVPNGVSKIAYAPSIGLSDIPECYTDDFKKYLSDFKAISVRENNAVELVKKYADKEAKWVLDPTMLLDGSAWSKLIDNKIIEKPYIFCYLFGTQDYYKDAIENIRNKTGLEVVIIPFSERDLTNEYTKIYKAGPIEFLSLIKNAEYVLTDSFHATVFSLLFERPFYTLLRDNDNEEKSMNSRIHSLLSMLDKQERCVLKRNVSGFKIEPILDYECVRSRLKHLRDDSINFLQNALEDEK